MTTINSVEIVDGLDEIFDERIKNLENELENMVRSNNGHVLELDISTTPEHQQFSNLKRATRAFTMGIEPVRTESAQRTRLPSVKIFRALAEV